MTTLECQSRDQRLLEKIAAVLRADETLCQYTASLQFMIEGSELVLTGQLPTTVLLEQLLPAIRRAGVLCRVQNRVRVAT